MVTNGGSPVDGLQQPVALIDFRANSDAKIPDYPACFGSLRHPINYLTH
jgi:hypothetical protein